MGLAQGKDLVVEELEGRLGKAAVEVGMAEGMVEEAEQVVLVVGMVDRLS